MAIAEMRRRRAGEGRQKAESGPDRQGARERGRVKGPRRAAWKALRGTERRPWQPWLPPELPVPIGKMTTALPPATASSPGGVDLEMLWAIDPATLAGVRKKDGKVAIYDVLRTVTLQAPDACRKIWRRLLETHPELVGICQEMKFGGAGRGNRQLTPATDARGIAMVLMVLPGPAATIFRMQAAGVLVRFLGGDPELVAEVWANRWAQEALAREQPDHPARVFGEAVEAMGTTPELAVEAPTASTPPALEDLGQAEQMKLVRAQTAQAEQQTKLLWLQCVEKGLQMAPTVFGTTDWHALQLARKAVTAAMVPPGQHCPDDMVDAVAYLGLQGHDAKEIHGLATEFGKWLKQRWLQEHGEEPLTAKEIKGTDEHWYHRKKDRQFLAFSYAAFKERPLFARVCPPDAALAKRTQAALEGSRGMPQPKRRCVTPPCHSEGAARVAAS